MGDQSASQENEQFYKLKNDCNVNRDHTWLHPIRDGLRVWLALARFPLVFLQVVVPGELHVTQITLEHFLVDVDRVHVSLEVTGL